MSTDTAHEQTAAARTALTLLTVGGDLAAPEVHLKRLWPLDMPASAWGATLSLHDGLADFEAWRAALGIDPVRVEHHQRSGVAWLIAADTYQGVPVHLIGYYDDLDPGGEG